MRRTLKWAGHVERMGDEKLTGIRNPERGRKKGSEDERKFDGMTDCQSMRMRDVTNKLDNGLPNFSSKDIFTLNIGI